MKANAAGPQEHSLRMCDSQCTDDQSLVEINESNVIADVCRDVKWQRSGLPLVQANLGRGSPRTRCVAMYLIGRIMS